MTAIRRGSFILRLLCALLAVLVTVRLLSVCADAPETPNEPEISETPEPPAPTSLTIIENGKFNFTVTRPQNTDNAYLIYSMGDIDCLS